MRASARAGKWEMLRVQVETVLGEGAGEQCSPGPPNIENPAIRFEPILSVHGFKSYEKFLLNSI